MDGIQELARLEDPAFYFDNPYPFFARLRNESPVFRYEKDGLSFWVLSKWEDIRYVSQNPDTFSNTHGIFIPDLRAYVDRGVLVTENTGPGGVKNIYSTDPPAHNKVRRLINKVFTPRMVALLESNARDIVDESLAQITPGEPFDFVEALAVPLPMFVIGDLLGVPREDRARFKRWADNGVSGGAITALAGDLESQISGRIAITNEMDEYFADLLERRKRDPRDDLVSGLAAAEIDGERLSPANQLMLCGSVLTAGNETTRNLITGATLALADHRDQLELLLKDPEMIKGAADEFLRWVTPVIAFARTATRRTVVRQQPIEEGDWILMLYQSGNRDEEVWDRPDVFDVARRPESMHLAFGWGQHVCLGQSLARLEIKVFFEQFLGRYPRFDIVGDPVRTPQFMINGVERVPVIVHG